MLNCILKATRQLGAGAVLGVGICWAVLSTPPRQRHMHRMVYWHQLCHAFEMQPPRPGYYCPPSDVDSVCLNTANERRGTVIDRIS